MGIITRIEDKLGDIVESPFRGKNGFDPLGIEISLKRLMELKRRNILGRVVVPNFLTIVINRRNYEEYELFLETFRNSLRKSVDRWARDKGYELAGQIEINLKEASLRNKPFEVFVSYKKDKGGNGNNDKADSKASKVEDTRTGNNIIVGELIDKRTGEKYRINNGTTIIGRGEDCTIRINDPTISRRHACLSFQHGKIVLEDLGSKSGTRVHCERVHKKILSSGNKIAMGFTELAFVSCCSN